MVGRRFDRVTIGRERTTRHNASPQEVENRLTGRRVESVRRHGKFLLIDLDEGFKMVAHLGMSGRFSVEDPGRGSTELAPHTHFVAELDDGAEVRFIDPRTFGFVAVYDEDEVSESGVSRLGPDAWEDPPTPADLADSLRGRTAPIKALLLDQGPLSGLGNIYADEVLHRAGLHPLTAGGLIPVQRLEVLLETIHEVLAGAIESGGTTLEDLAYLLPDGRAGENLGRLAVYGREGEPCPDCGTAIERTVVRGRSTFYCPRCQED